MVLRYFNREKPRAKAEPAEISASTEVAQAELIAECHNARMEHDQSVQSSHQQSEETTIPPSAAEEDDQNTVLSDGDELFLRKVVSEAEPPPLPPRPPIFDDGNSADQQLALEREKQYKIHAESRSENVSDTKRDPHGRRPFKDVWTSWGLGPRRTSKQSVGGDATASEPMEQDRFKARDREEMANALQSVAEGLKQESAPKDEESEEARERQDVSSVLNRLNLSAINNRVVSLSQDTQNLLEAFNQVVKDLINGVPTAYGDLEKLLTQRQAQIDKLYDSLPPFLQKLVQTIPAKAYAALAPQVAAAMNAKKGERTEDAEQEDAKGAEKKSKSKKSYVPSLRTLLGKNGAVATMLRAIFEFLEARFPLLLGGTNVLMCLSLFLLLFVFWYCHKRGRAARLANEKADLEVSEGSVSDLEAGADGDRASVDVDRDNNSFEATSNNAEDAELQKKIDALAENLSKPTPKPS